MKNKITNSLETLENLLKVNNDRLEGYRKAAEETLEIDLKTIFQSMGDESKKNVDQLIREMKKMGVQATSTSTSTGGKLYRVWMDLKATLTGRDRTFILDSCEYGEDMAQDAYRLAISSNDLSTEVRQMIRNQQMALIASHDWIKNYRERSQFGYAKTF